jgi:hypothetical protein
VVTCNTANKVGPVLGKPSPPQWFFLFFFPSLCFRHEAEIKSQPESTFDILNSYPMESLPCHIALRNLAPFLTPAASSKPVCASVDRTNRWAPHTMQVSPNHSQEHKPAQILGRLMPCPPNKTEKQIVNCNQTQTAEGAGGMQKLHWRKGAGQGAKLSTELSVNKHRKGSKGWEWSGDKPLPETGKIMDHRAHLLSQRAASKTELPSKAEKHSEL